VRVVRDALYSVTFARYKEHGMTMTIDNPRFPEFLERLTGPEGINLRDDGKAVHSNDCGPADTSRTQAILRDMGLNDDEVASSLAYFAARGGFNDQEILLDVGITAGDEEAIRDIEED
jgi:hypothetical protein